MSVLISETYINETEGYIYGETTEPYEPFTDDLGELFRYGQKEYGRCVSKAYVDTDDGPKAVGWVFQKRTQYEDCDDTYVREVWVTLHSAPRPPRPPAPYLTI